MQEKLEKVNSLTVGSLKCQAFKQLIKLSTCFHQFVSPIFSWNISQSEQLKKKKVFATNSLHQLKIQEKKVNLLTVGSLKYQAFKHRLLFNFNLASGCKFIICTFWFYNFRSI
jgi:hypothetical protein